MKYLIFSSGAPSFGSGLTRFQPTVTAGISTAISAEVRAQVTHRSSTVLRNLYVNVRGNSLSAATTIRLRKNGANGNLVVSIPAATTGTFEDAANSDSVTPGDAINYSIVTGSGSGSITTHGISVLSDNYSRLSTLNGAGAGISFSSSTEYLPIVGNNGTVVVEGEAQFRVGTAGTLKNMYVYISGNSRTTACTYRLRKNGANGNLVVSIPAGSTGAFEDTTNSDALAVDDLVNASLSTGSGGGTLTSHLCGYEFVGSGGFLLPGGPTSGISQSAGTTFFYSCTGTQSSNENHCEYKSGTKASLRRLTINISSNGVSSASTFTLRRSSTNTAVSLSIPAATTGIFVDPDNQAPVQGTDLICARLVTGTGGTSLTLRTLGWAGTFPQGLGNFLNFFE